MGIDKHKSLLPAVAELRRQAEANLRAKNAARRPPRNEEATLRLVHELEVHQIELEMQNEELLRILEELGVSRNELNDKAALQEAALAKVAEKERLLSGILDGIQDGICMLDENLRIIRVNPFFEQYYAEKMPFLGQKCHEVFWSSMEPCEQCPSIRTLQSGDRATMIFSDTHGGKKFWFELETFPILNAEKSSVTGVVECVRDITERKRAESREHGRRQTLELLAGRAPLAQVLKQVVTTYEMEYEGSFCSILLLDAQQRHLLLGAAPNLPDFYNYAIHGLEIGPEAGSCGSAAFTGKRVIVEDVLTHPFWEAFRPLAQKAGLRACWSEPIFSSAGAVLGTFAVYYPEPMAPDPDELNLISDMATLAGIAIEHNIVQENLRALSCGIEHSPASIVITDRKGNIEYVNPKFTRLTGYTLAEAVGRNPSILKSGLTPAETYRQLWDTITTGGEWHGELCNRKKNGDLYWESASISPDVDSEGNITRFIAVKEDITRNKRIQEELVEKVSQLEAALAKVKQLEGIIPICMYCKKIRDDKESWHQLEKYITDHSDALFSHGICPECYREATIEALKEFDNTNQH